MSETNTSVIKALEVLDLLEYASQGVRLKDIALRLDLPESTTHRLLASLAEKGYVQQREHSGVYALGWRIVTLARSLNSESRLIQDIRSHLEKLLFQVRSSVNLGVLNGSQVIYLDCLVPGDAISMYVRPGTTAPAHASALGKALLAFLPPPELEVVLSQLSLERFTSQTITTLPPLIENLEETRRRGFATDHGEWQAGVNCIAVPVQDPQWRAIAAISTSVRALEIAGDWEERTARVLISTARTASRDLFGGDK